MRKLNNSLVACFSPKLGVVSSIFLHKILISKRLPAQENQHLESLGVVCGVWSYCRKGVAMWDV